MSNKYQLKEIFTVIGKMQLTEGKHRFIPNSPSYLADRLSRISLGKEISCMFSEHVPTRSEAQLAYHWVLVHYIAEHCGYTDEEIHDAIMRLKFGTKNVIIGNRKVEVRKSISNKARLPKYMAIELISYDLQLCEELKIKVPTAQELGYISNY